MEKNSRRKKRRNFQRELIFSSKSGFHLSGMKKSIWAEKNCKIIKMFNGNGARYILMKSTYLRTEYLLRENQPEIYLILEIFEEIRNIENTNGALDFQLNCLLKRRHSVNYFQTKITF